MRKINEIIVHCAATKPGMDIGKKEIDRWHKRRGWNGIGYHYVIRRDGTLEHGRELSKMGAHCKGRNRNSVGICLVGGINYKGKPENNFNSRQFETLKILIDELKSNYPDIEKISGHKDYANKACPCFDVHKMFGT